MKPEIFIGSSKESKQIAYAVQEELKDDGNVTVWSQGIFRLSSSTIDDLLDTQDKSDFGVFIFSADDLVQIRQQNFQTVRDNVIFELGLFIGGLGKKRNFFILPEDGNDLRIPTDLLGITSATYDSHRTDNLQAALGPACNGIRKAISQLGIRKRTLPMPNTVIEQPENWFYHFRIQKVYEKEEPEFTFNSNKAYLTMAATKLYNGQHTNIAGIVIDGISITSGMVSLMILRSKERVDTISLKEASVETKEQYWHGLRYSPGVIDITAELDITDHYAA